MKKYYKINGKILQNKINKQIIILKTAKNGPLCEVKFTKPKASFRIFLTGMRRSGLNNILVKLGSQQWWEGVGLTTYLRGSGGKRLSRCHLASLFFE